MPLRKRIVLIHRIFSSYRKPVYDKLALEYDFFVLHSYNSSGIETTQTNYSKKIRHSRYGKKETQIYLHCIKKLFQIKPDVVIHEFAIGILSMPMVYLWCKLFKRKFVLYSHGYDRKKGFFPKKSFGDKYRLWYLKKADAIILYGEKDKKLLSEYINPIKIFVANNTLDTDTLLPIRVKMEIEGRDNVKKRLGFESKYNLIFIGRLLKDKLPHLLIDLLDFLPKNILSDVTIHIVGDGPEKENMNLAIRQKEYTEKVKFYGKVHDDFLSGSLLYASDLMVMPGYVGLSVNHAFCFQCPVITFEGGSNGLFHSPEEAYIIDNETGFRVKEFKVEDMADCINNYLSNESMQHSVRANIKTFVEKELTIDKMVGGFIDGVEFVGRK